MSNSDDPAAISANPTTSAHRRSKPVNGRVLDLPAVVVEPGDVSVFAATPLDGVVGVLVSFDGVVPVVGVVEVVGVVVVVGVVEVVVVVGGVVLVVVVVE